MKRPNAEQAAARLAILEHVRELLKEARMADTEHFPGLGKTGTAQRAELKPHKAKRNKITPPAPKTAEYCRERAKEAAWFLPEFEAKRNAATLYWRHRNGRYAELAGMAQDELRAEVEYWRELELLSGQRDRFKPGMAAEVDKADDEVAA